MRGNLYRLPLAVVAEASSARSQLAWSDTSAPLRRSRAAFGRCRLMLRPARSKHSAGLCSPGSQAPAIRSPTDLATDCLATRKSWHEQGGCVMNPNTTGRLSSGSGRSATVRLCSWRKVCTPAPPRRLSRCLFGAAFLVLVLSATIALSGCATTQPVRYTPVYCLSNGTQLPAEPPKVHDQLTGHADKDAGILAGSAIRLRAWGQALNYILEGCREPTH
jgi:hypothetical protein